MFPVTGRFAGKSKTIDAGQSAGMNPLLRRASILKMMMVVAERYDEL
jgi:hypothetical protein